MASKLNCPALWIRCISGILFTVLLVLPVRSEIIASCGPFSGYSHYFKDEFNDNAEWKDGDITGTIIFTKSGTVLDVISSSKLGGENWTRSASDYGAHVVEVNAAEGVRHIIVVWKGATELYALDMERKTITLLAHKTGAVDVARAMVGECE